MLWYVALIFAIAALFYLGVPGIGAFLVRAQWRHFRFTINDVSRYPSFDPRAIGRQKSAFIGYFRFFGTLEAIQGDNRIWVTNGSHSVAAELRNVTVYLLPAAAPTDRDTADDELRAVPWNRIYSLPQGTTILVGGALFSEEGRAVFRASGKASPLVVIYDCKREQIMERVTWSGRQRNEYWNQFTIPSLITGSFSLLLLAYFLLSRTDLRIPALTALAAGLGPAAPFLPPAFPLYFIYRRFWKRARLMRAQRDIVRLPLRYFPNPTGGSRFERSGESPTGASSSEPRSQRAILLPDLEPYVMLRGRERRPSPGRNDGATPPGSVFTSAGHDIALPPETERIDLALPRRIHRRLTDGEFVFGAYSEEGEGIRLKRPEDSMAELVLLPGDPREISQACSRAARNYELVSALFIGINVAVNEIALLLLLARIIG